MPDIRFPIRIYLNIGSEFRGKIVTGNEPVRGLRVGSEHGGLLDAWSQQIPDHFKVSL